MTDNGKLWTSSGVSAGTDAFLALLEAVYGKDKDGKTYADLISDGMEWTRITDSHNDPFARMNDAEDVLPVKQ